MFTSLWSNSSTPSSKLRPTPSCSTSASSNSSRPNASPCCSSSNSSRPCASSSSSRDRTFPFLRVLLFWRFWQLTIVAACAAHRLSFCRRFLKLFFSSLDPTEWASAFFKMSTWGQILSQTTRLFITHFQLVPNRTAHIRYQCSKTTVLSYHRCLINTGVEKMSNI